MRNAAATSIFFVAAVVLAAAPPQTVTLQKPDGATVATIRTTDVGPVEIHFTGDGKQQLLRGDAHERGKRKYRFGEGPLWFEIRPHDDGFKLRMADGTLRWKVKLSDKVKISDNEENRNPWELKSSGDHVKVVGPDGREIGSVRFDAASKRTQVRDAAGTVRFVVPAQALAGSYGVLLLDRIPPPQQYILIAELLARGR